MTTRVMRPPKGETPRATAELGQFVAERLEHEPQWSVFAGTGAWICPFCLAPEPTVQPGERVAGIVNHLATRCGPFRAGAGEETRRREVAQSARGGVEALVARIRDTLHSRIWRYRNREHDWICPYCLVGVPGVRLRDPVDWDRAARQMGTHLAIACGEFRSTKGIRQSEESIRDATGEPEACDFSFLAPAPVQPVPAPLGVASE